MFINFANLNVTWLECEIAYFLKAAFPAMVIPAINAETVEAIAIEMKSPFDAMAIFVNILAPSAPDKILHISPMTSVQIALIRSAFFMRDIACLLPFTCLDAIAKNGSTELEVTATPNISKTILIAIKINMTITAIIILAFESAISLTTLNVNDKNIARKNTFTGHTHHFCDLFFICFFFLF